MTCRLSLDLAARQQCDPQFSPQVVCTQRATDKKGRVRESIFNVYKVRAKIENIGRKCYTQSVFITQPCRQEYLKHV